MSFFKLSLIGILIGAAMIVPGVSGGVIAVIFGVYNKMIYSLTNLFKDFKKSFIFLFFLGIGILIGAVWFSNVMVFLYEKHEVITKLAFIGLILGGVPFLFKEVKKNGNGKVNYAVLTITFVFCLLLFFLSKNVFKVNLDASYSSFFVKNVNLFLAGVIYSVGKVVPGVSGSFLLITIGMYEYVLSVMAHPIKIGLLYIDKLIPFIIGLVLGIVILLKIMNRLLKRNFNLIYSVIIGFVLGSIPTLVPKIHSLTELVFGMIMMAMCFILSYKLTK